MGLDSKIKTPYSETFELGWTTHWQIESFGVQVAPIKMRKHYSELLDPQYIAYAFAMGKALDIIS